MRVQYPNTTVAGFSVRNVTVSYRGYIDDEGRVYHVNILGDFPLGQESIDFHLSEDQFFADIEQRIKAAGRQDIDTTVRFLRRMMKQLDGVNG